MGLPSSSSKIRSDDRNATNATGNQTRPILPAGRDPAAIQEDTRHEIKITAQQAEQQLPLPIDENWTMVPEPSRDSNPAAVS